MGGAGRRGVSVAHVGGRWLTDLLEVSRDPSVLSGEGLWVVLGTFEGEWTFARFARALPEPPATGVWPGVEPSAWRSSMVAAAYLDGVAEIRARIARGEVYQVNLCRLLTADLSPGADLAALHERLRRGNPAPFSAAVLLPDHGVEVVSASPELYLRRRSGTVTCAPIKGTARAAKGLLAKDAAENVMITDMVRNDLGRICAIGSIRVDGLLDVEHHPGLVHLVSTVRGELAAEVSWAALLATTFPAASVTGAPRSTAMQAIRALEPVPRGPYCGAIGWVDASTGDGELAVGIRTFFRARDALVFGAGAGITWGSRPEQEWQETELKTSRLLGLAS